MQSTPRLCRSENKATEEELRLAEAGLALTPNSRECSNMKHFALTVISLTTGIIVTMAMIMTHRQHLQSHLPLHKYSLSHDCSHWDHHHWSAYFGMSTMLCQSFPFPLLWPSSTASERCAASFQWPESADIISIASFMIAAIIASIVARYDYQNRRCRLLPVPPLSPS